MSTSTATSKPSRSESPPEGGRYDQFIEQRLDKTRVQVKLVDLAGATMVLAAGVLGVLLVLAIIDHWVISLGAWGRWLSLAGLLGGVAWYVTRTIVPLAFGQISSVYAARTIEKSEPSLKNSLINFLMFRSDRAGLRASVYQALRHQAATDLSHVQVETAVDRAKLIKIGYILAGVLALCATYAILSPRSTFQSAFRIIAPWADVDPPSRVRIEDIQPGNKEVYHGESVSVSATCYDVRESEPVTLFYSTLDGGVSRESVEMQPAEQGLIYRCPLAPGGDGIQRDLVYWIEAGDARSSAYRLTVLPAPTVLVDRIEYEYPAYTGQPEKVVERQGDVKGLEGTRVTVHASANVAIQSAVIEFDPSEVMADDEGQAAAPESAVTSSLDPERLELDFEGQRAWGSFVLELDATRTRPKRSFYRIRFSTEDGTQNPFPVLHRIEVTRDLSPEIEILTPTRDRIEVPEDGQQKIEVRGIDPDYGLSKITLRAVAGGHDVTTATLLDDPAGQTGQIVAGYAFKPQDHGLRAGDAVAYWAAAEDNRTLPGTEDPAPNTAKTRTYHLIIVPSEEQSGPDNQGPDQEEPEPDLSSPPSHPRETAPPDATTADDGSTEPMEGEGQEGDQSGGQGSEGSQASSDSSDSESGGSEQDGTGGQGSGTDANAETASGTEANDGGQQTGDSGTAGETAPDGSTGEGSERSTGGGQSAQPSGSGSGQTGSGGKPGSKQQATPSETGAEPTGEGAYGEEPLHDGEAFEKALEHMRNQQGGDSADASSGGQAGGKPESGDASSGPQSPQGQDGGGAKDSPQKGGADGSAGGGLQQTGQPKPQDGQGSEASGAAQQQEGKPQDEPGAPKGGQQKSDASQGAGQKKEGASGSSGKPKGGAQPQQGKKPSNSGAGKPKDSGQGDSGDSGSGQSSQEKSGSAGAQQENRDKQKKGGSQSGKPKPGGGSQSPSHSQRQSDSSGGKDGDRSGGGKQGGGQGAKQKGNDSAGSNSPGDEGASASSESGAGDEANRPGDRAPAEGETGTPGVQKGQGSDTDPAPGGKGQGGTADGPDQAESRETVSGSPTEGATDKRGQGIPMGGGKPSNAELRGFDLTGEVPPAEQPNLKYAREATNLVLDYLKDQQDAPDQELLDKLGWTDDQMRDFISRWESMKNAAVEDRVGERQLDEALRSLGLRPRRGTTRHVESRNDESRGLRDAGGQSNPPPGYEEQFKAYKKGTARTGGN